MFGDLMLLRIGVDAEITKFSSIIFFMLYHIKHIRGYNIILFVFFLCCADSCSTTSLVLHVETLASAQNSNFWFKVKKEFGYNAAEE